MLHTLRLPARFVPIGQKWRTGKEHESVWSALGLEFEGCHCLLGRDDGLVGERDT